MKNDKEKLSPLLRAFKMGYVDIDYAIEQILDIYTTSRRFNFDNFLSGVSAGLIIAMILMYFFS